jgi:hypothetical protein
MHFVSLRAAIHLKEQPVVHIIFIPENHKSGRKGMQNDHFLKSLYKWFAW